LPVSKTVIAVVEFFIKNVLPTNVLIFSSPANFWEVIKTASPGCAKTAFSF